MPYRFKLDEKFDSAFRRIVREQVKQAEAELSAADIPASAIHETRKSIKRLRALLKTAAPSLGAKAARKHDRAFRDIGRELSNRRDGDVLVATIATLESRFGADGISALAPLKTALQNQTGNAEATLDAVRVQALRDALKSEGKRLRKARLKGHGLAAIIDGVGATYTAGRRGLKRASKHPTDEHIHELRKAVQAHWRHMSLLSRAWPEEFATRVMAARELSQILGDDHDLALVKAAAVAHAAPDTALSDAAAIVDLCNRRQDELRATMKPIALRLYAEDPQAFTQRMMVYWQTARRTADATKASSAPSLAEKANGAANPAEAAGSPADLAAKTPG